MKGAAARGIARVVVPGVAVATVAIGLRLGARTDLRAALLYTAPPAAMRRGLAWQIHTVLEEEGVREAAPHLPVDVRARAHGREATWSGTTNADGVAEVWLDLPDVAAGDPVEVLVTSPEVKAPLAEGTVRTDTDDLRVELVPSFLAPSKREGPIAIDVAVADGKLTLGFPSRLWVRTVDRVTGAPLGGVKLTATPEAGLLIATPEVTTCESGWAELMATAQGHVVGTTLHAVGPAAATSGSGGGGARPEAPAPRGKSAPTVAAPTGEWFGGTPVGLGASFSDVPIATDGAPFELEVVNPTPRPVGYVEVDDVKGRAFAAALDFALAPDGMRHARVKIPALLAGDYWVVSSGDPRGADRLGGSSIARPMRVLPAGAPPLGCAAKPAQALTQPRGFPRLLSLDGTHAAYGRAARARQRGLYLAVGALVVAALLEVLLFLRERRRSKDEAARAEAALEAAGVTEDAERLGLYGTTGAVAIGLGLTLLGFALLAAMVLYRGT